MHMLLEVVPDSLALTALHREVKRVLRGADARRARRKEWCGASSAWQHGRTTISCNQQLIACVLWVLIERQQRAVLANNTCTVNA
jgi:hypothetical protein